MRLFILRVVLLGALATRVLVLFGSFLLYLWCLKTRWFDCGSDPVEITINNKVSISEHDLALVCLLVKRFAFLGVKA